MKKSKRPFTANEIKIRTALAEKNMTQRELVEKIGISKAGLYEFMKGMKSGARFYHKGEIKMIDQRIVLDKDFRIYGDFENPLFLAKDVAKWIEHSDVSIMIKTVDDNVINFSGGTKYGKNNY